MQSERWPRVEQPISRTIARDLTIAIVAGAVLSVVRHAPFLAPSGALLALWPSLGGHFVEIAFLNGVRSRLPRARLVQASARLFWLVGGALLGGALIATAEWRRARSRVTVRVLTSPEVTTRNERSGPATLDAAYEKGDSAAI